VKHAVKNVAKTNPAVISFGIAVVTTNAGSQGVFACLAACALQAASVVIWAKQAEAKSWIAAKKKRVLIFHGVRGV
jgi:hypothetical protein